MKMPSTYISLLLLCGFVYVFYFSHHPRQTVAPAIKHPVVKEMRPVVKRFSPAQHYHVPLNKNNEGHERDLLQARLTIDGFSFFKDVICRIAPILKNVR